MFLVWLAVACGRISPVGAPVLGAQIPVVPGAGLPAEVEVQPANNNLDVIRYDGAVFLAFRTAPTHFAGPDTMLHVVRSEDQQTWTHELSLEQGTDLREPRFLSLDDQLFLYFAVLGDSPTAFEPAGSMVVVRDQAGTWSEPAWQFTDGFIPWRTRIIDGVPHMFGYTGGSQVYEVDGEWPDMEVHWLTTDDGYVWTGFAGDDPMVHVGGASETDMVFADDGAAIAVMRNEAGEAEHGFGSLICRAEPDALGEWNCVADPRKYDSPLLIEQNGRIWLIARRQLENDGHYDLGMDDLGPREQFLHYQMAYWGSAKRCSLWEVDPDSLEVSWSLDLPSRGDTCFPGAIPDSRVPNLSNVWTVYNYSSDPVGPDLSWLDGQLAPTGIYRQDIVLP